jgi:hypothetical protein
MNFNPATGAHASGDLGDAFADLAETGEIPDGEATDNGAPLLNADARAQEFAQAARVLRYAEDRGMIEPDPDQPGSYRIISGSFDDGDDSSAIDDSQTGKIAPQANRPRLARR